MKKFSSLLFIVLLMMIVVGCENNKSSKELDDENVYSFQYEKMNILLGDTFTREKYGDELEYSETTTCAFEDMDRTYIYEHYAIDTYTLNEEERILSIYFLDSNVTTTEGISLGDSLEKVEEVYGKDYQKNDNLYTYEKGKTNLKFIVENDVVTSIEYTYDVEN